MCHGPDDLSTFPSDGLPPRAVLPNDAALISGPAGFFLTRMAVPVAVSVSGSLVIALVFIPLCVYLTLTSRDKLSIVPPWFKRWHLKSNDVLRGAYDRSFGRLNETYNKVLERCLERPLHQRPTKKWIKSTVASGI